MEVLGGANECPVCEGMLFEEPPEYDEGGPVVPWPLLEDGEPEEGAFLIHVPAGINGEITASLIEVNGVPVRRLFPVEGGFAAIYFGTPPAGMDIYVPESALATAREILAAEILE